MFTVHPDDWRQDAACRTGVDPELFFPVGDAGPARAQEADAIAVCRDCPVRAECLTRALENGESGVWGATTEAQRRALRAHNAVPV